MTDMTVSRRMLGGLAAGAAAAGVAAPAAAQRSAPMRMPSVSSLTAGDWMAQVKAQHMAIDAGFQRLKATRESDGRGRQAALMDLAGLLTGHSIAEQVALYPGVALVAGDRPGSDKLYMDQQHAKVMVAELMNLPMTGPEFMTRLTALEAAVKAHVADEEGREYPELMRAADRAMNEKMTADFRREFTKYMA